MNHALDAAQVDERAERLDGRDLAGHDRALAQAGAGLLGARLVLFVEQRTAREDEVGLLAIELVPRDAELELLADEDRRVLDELVGELRDGTERANSGHLDLDATLDHGRDQTLDRDAVRVRLDQLGLGLGALAHGHAQHHRVATHLRDARLDGVAHGHARDAFGVTHLRELDHGLGLGAELHEGRLAANGDHASAHDVAYLGQLAALGCRLLTLELIEERAEIFFLLGLLHARSLWRKSRNIHQLRAGPARLETTRGGQARSAGPPLLDASRGPRRGSRDRGRSRARHGLRSS